MDKETIKTIYENYFVNKSSRNLKLIFDAYNSLSPKHMVVSNCSTCIEKIRKLLLEHINK